MRSIYSEFCTSLNKIILSNFTLGTLSLAGKLNGEHQKWITPVTTEVARRYIASGSAEKHRLM